MQISRETSVAARACVIFSKRSGRKKAKLTINTVGRCLLKTDARARFARLHRKYITSATFSAPRTYKHAAINLRNEWNSPSPESLDYASNPNAVFLIHDYFAIGLDALGLSTSRSRCRARERANACVLIGNSLIESA